MCVTAPWADGGCERVETLWMEMKDKKRRSYFWWQAKQINRLYSGSGWRSGLSSYQTSVAEAESLCLHLPSAASNHVKWSGNQKDTMTHNFKRRLSVSPSRMWSSIIVLKRHLLSCQYRYWTFPSAVANFVCHYMSIFWFDLSDCIILFLIGQIPGAKQDLDWLVLGWETGFD